jgi:hypothetical protein
VSVWVSGREVEDNACALIQVEMYHFNYKTINIVQNVIHFYNLDCTCNATTSFRKESEVLYMYVNDVFSSTCLQPSQCKFVKVHFRASIRVHGVLYVMG